MNKIKKFSSTQEMAESAAYEIELFLGNKKSRIAVAGGTTPKPLYNILREKLDWANISITLTDERVDDKSNEAMLRKNLLSSDAILGNMEDAGSLDLVILGMGEDGHIASLFPGEDMDDDGKPYIKTTSPNPPHSRISLTLSSILNGKKIILYISGENKLKTYEEAMHNPKLPAYAILNQDEVPVTTYWAP